MLVSSPPRSCPIAPGAGTWPGDAASCDMAAAAHPGMAGARKLRSLQSWLDLVPCIGSQR
eukprot:9499033-Pyramimonas_sp.AAC.1